VDSLPLVEEGLGGGVRICTGGKTHDPKLTSPQGGREPGKGRVDAPASNMVPTMLGCRRKGRADRHYTAAEQIISVARSPVEWRHSPLPPPPAAGGADSVKAVAINISMWGWRRKASPTQAVVVGAEAAGEITAAGPDVAV